jgi:hypothetical protein
MSLGKPEVLELQRCSGKVRHIAGKLLQLPAVLSPPRHGFPPTAPSVRQFAIAKACRHGMFDADGREDPRYEQ